MTAYNGKNQKTNKLPTSSFQKIRHSHRHRNKKRSDNSPAYFLSFKSFLTFLKGRKYGEIKTGRKLRQIDALHLSQGVIPNSLRDKIWDLEMLCKSWDRCRN